MTEEGDKPACGMAAVRRPFDPVAHELDANFRLTRFADLKGWGCKVPQEVLLKLLEGLQQDGSAQESEQSHFQYVAACPRIGEFGLPVSLMLGRLGSHVDLLPVECSL